MVNLRRLLGLVPARTEDLTPHNTDTTATRPSPLLELPAELRNRIFELVVVFPDPIPARLIQDDHEKTEDEIEGSVKVASTSQTRATASIPAATSYFLSLIGSIARIVLPAAGVTMQPTKLPLQSALSRVNRQTRAEVLPVYYGQNTFLLTETVFTLNTPHNDLSKVFDIFANDTARKHVRHIIDVCKARPSWPSPIPALSVAITLDEQNKLRFSITEGQEDVCLCAAWQYLTALVERDCKGGGGQSKLQSAYRRLGRLGVQGGISYLKSRPRREFCVHCEKPRHYSDNE